MSADTRNKISCKSETSLQASGQVVKCANSSGICLNPPPVYDWHAGTRLARHHAVKSRANRRAWTAYPKSIFFAAAAHDFTARPQNTKTVSGAAYIWFPHSPKKYDDIK